MSDLSRNERRAYKSGLLDFWRKALKRQSQMIGSSQKATNTLQATGLVRLLFRHGVIFHPLLGE